MSHTSWFQNLYKYSNQNSMYKYWHKDNEQWSRTIPKQTLAWGSDEFWQGIDHTMGKGQFL